MKPFKLFFALSLGIILFLFFAKIVLIALIAAFVMSVIYSGFRKMKHFVQRTLWEEDYEEDYFKHYYKEDILPNWKEALFTNPAVKRKVYLDNHRTIIVK